MSTRVKEEPIAIVGTAAILPGARDTAAFWRNLVAYESQLLPMPVSRWPQGLQGDDTAALTTYVAATIGDDVLHELCADLHIDSANLNRLEILAIAAFAQLAVQLDMSTLAARRTQFCFGCMDPHEELELAAFASLWRQQCNTEESANEDEQSLLARFQQFEARPTSSVIAAIKKHFALTGEGCLIDAACASSLAAIHVGAQKLLHDQADLIFVGGLEADMLPVSFGSFELVGALSDEPCRPFDHEHAGLCQGEGVVLFALQRLEDAIGDGHHIWGVIRAVGSSSDGRGTSLFEPSANGQSLAYSRAYARLENNRVDYVEAHGTGTPVGDNIELRSLNAFFGDIVTPIGSAKALVGHTRGAAGAVGLLKALLLMRHRIIPPSPYFRRFPKSTITRTLRINRKPVKLRERRTPLRVGVSSFGFGGANYHLVVDEYKEKGKPKHPLDGESGDRHNKPKHPLDGESGNRHNPADATKMAPVVIVGSGVAGTTAVQVEELAARFRIVPASVRNIDLLHQQALLAVAAALESTGLELQSLDRPQISVISASMLGLQKRWDYVAWTSFSRLEEVCRENPELLARLERRRAHLIRPSEDTSPGILNNVTAGRVCGYYDLGGKSFNVECDTNSFPCALAIAGLELQSGESEMVVLVWADESFDAQTTNVINRGDVHCWLLTLEPTAAKNALGILGVVERIDYEEPNNG